MTNPPGHLKTAGKALWRRLQEEFDLSDAYCRTQLQAACEHADDAQTLRSAIEHDGHILIDRYGGKKLHPAVTGFQKASAAMQAALKPLGLNLEPVGDIGRPAGS